MFSSVYLFYPLLFRSRTLVAFFLFFFFWLSSARAPAGPAIGTPSYWRDLLFRTPPRTTERGRLRRPAWEPGGSPFSSSGLTQPAAKMTNSDGDGEIDESFWAKEDAIDERKQLLWLNAKPCAWGSQRALPQAGYRRVGDVYWPAPGHAPCAKTSTEAVKEKKRPPSPDSAPEAKKEKKEKGEKREKRERTEEEKREKRERKEKKTQKRDQQQQP